MEITNNPETAKLFIQGFLIGLQCTLMLVFIIITIIDLKNTKKEWKSTESWINQIDTQLKFEAQMVDMIVKQDNRLSKIEENLGIKEEKEDEQRDSNKEM